MRLFLIGFLSLVLFSCGNSGLKERDNYRKLLGQGKYKEAIDFVKNNDFYNEKDNALLKYLELGMGHHMAGEYFQSTKYLDQAKEIHQKLFTVSLSKKASTLVTNENFDTYYGYTYERSLIHFYLSLNHLLLWQQGNYESYTKLDSEGNEKIFSEKKLSNSERQFELQGARAELLSWDTYLKDQANQKRGRSVFKVDLLAKTYGAFVHETIGTRTDKQIALQLYKDAKKFLFRYYNSYKTFNKKNKLFRKDFNKLAKLKTKEIEKKYITSTNYQSSLKDYLDFKILSLTKKLDPKSLGKMKRLHKPTKETLRRFKKEKGETNVGVVYASGFIPAKIPSKEYYGFGAVLNDPKASGAAKAAAKIGAVVIAIFAANTLGLVPPPRSYRPIGTELGVRTALLATEHAAIAFELPKIRPKRIKNRVTITTKNGEKTIFSEMDLPVINPMGDIASEAIIEDSSSKYKKLGSRLVIKHLTAIIAAYATYSAIKNSGRAGFFAKQAAALQYLASSKGIEASEKADVRYWSSLPETIRFADYSIPTGNQNIILQEKNGNDVVKETSLGDIAIGNSRHILSTRTRF